jgi:hypothetical protein
MRNLYVTISVGLLILLTSINSHAQLSNKVDSCKFALSAGFILPPYPTVLQQNNYPPFFVATYYLNPKTAIDLGYAPLFYRNNESQEENEFNLMLSICRHPKLNKWLYLMYGINIEYDYNRVFSQTSYTDYGYSAGISFGVEVKLYKNLFLINRTDIGMGSYVYKENPADSPHTQFFWFNVLGTGLKLRF